MPEDIYNKLYPSREKSTPIEIESYGLKFD